MGFLLKENVGYCRDFPFSEQVIQLADDLTVTDLEGMVTLTRTAQGVYVSGRLQATLRHACVRCLEEYDQPLSCTLADLFFYPPQNAPENALFIGEDAHLDLAPLTRENMLLSVPMRALCSPNCRGLCSQCGQNLNYGDCGCQREFVDHKPFRWGGKLSYP